MAQDIVYEMKKIINKNINYIQTDGTILASMDKERIEQRHEGAEIVFQTEQMLIIEYDKQYLGTLKE